MSKKRNEKESMIFIYAKIKPNFLCLLYTKQKKFFTEKGLFKEKGERRIEQKNKMAF